MAGFLRRKTKNAETAPTKQQVSITPSSSDSQPQIATPLFARFATLAQQQQQQQQQALGNSNGFSGEPSGGIRVVSSPMHLSNGVRRENTTGGSSSSSRGYGASSASIASGRSQAGKRQQTGPPSSFQNDEQAALTRQSLDKPLPTPGAPPSPTNFRRTSSRGPPPAAILAKQSARSRTSLIIPDDKPLPVPGEQAHQQPRAPPITGRKLSLQTSFQPTPQPSAPRSPTRVTNLLDDEFDDVTPQALKPQHRVGAGGDNARAHGHGLDIAPELALYQEFITASASSTDSGRVAPQTKPASSNGRSSAAEKKTSATTPQHPKVTINPPPDSEPIPTSTSSTMGNTNSVLTGSSRFPSTIAPLASRAFIDPSPSHGNPHFKPVGINPKSSMRRVGYSTPSPPPPPGASAPVVPDHMQESYYQQPSQPSQNANYAVAPDAQTYTPPIVKGRPRIFAAMAAADTEADVNTHSQPNANTFSNHLETQQTSGLGFEQQPAYSDFQSNSGQDATYPNHLRADYYMSIASPPPPPSAASFSSNGYHNHALQPQGSRPPLSPPASHTSHISHSPLLNPPMQYYDSSGAHAQDPSSRSDTMRTPRTNPSRPLPIPNINLNGSSKSLHRHSPPGAPTPPQTPPRPRKLSKARHPSEVSMMLSNGSATSIISASLESVHSSPHKIHQHGGHRTLAKTQPPLPTASPLSLLQQQQIQQLQLQQQQQQQQQQGLVPGAVPHGQATTRLDDETIRNAGIPLDDDPFAKVEGVRMLSPIVGSGADPGPSAVAAPLREGSIKSVRPRSSKGEAEKTTASIEVGAEKIVGGGEGVPAPVEAVVAVVPQTNGVPPKKVKEGTKEERRAARREKRARDKEQRERDKQAAAAAAARAEGQPGSSSTRASGDAEPEFEPVVGEELNALNEANRKSFPLNQLLAHPQLLANLLSYFSFYDWCILSSVTRDIRIMLVQSPHLREEVFERYLKTVGYARWAWEDREPLSLSLQDLADYMRGVSTPSHEYARVAKMYVHSLTVNPNVRDPSLEQTVRSLTASTRAYTRVVLRLRAQAEKEASLSTSNPTTRSASTPPSASIRNGVSNGFVNGYSNGYTSSRSASRPSSRAPSPAMSNYSHSGAHGSTNATMQSNASQTSLGFRSPLFRLRRAPLLRVFVPSPEGDWLSDRSVLECEEECKRAGILHLMRMGDVVWDIAVGDEGNVGRLVYDGKYLIDLDYTFNPIGDLPKYIPTLAFPPSYFHRVIRTGAVTSNPVVHVDISPWGEEIAANLQLLQDRVKTETPQGAYHNVVRWVHRSSFVIRPPPRVMQRGPSINGRGQPHAPRIPIPDMDNLFIDAGWYGTIVVETEGTNEALADLQDRCGPRAFPPRPRPLNPAQMKAQQEIRKVFRILREKSRPGEIWIKAVGVKERIL